MNLTYLLKGVEKSTIKLSENQLFSVRRKNVDIRCLYGNLWITWPKRGEIILKSGQSFRVSSKGKICIVALSNAFFQISKKRWYANTRSHGEPAVTNENTDIIQSLFKRVNFLTQRKKNNHLI